MPLGGRRARFACLTGMIAVLTPRLTWACEVCYGQADSPWIDAAQLSVWVLLGLTVAVQVTFAVFFLRLRSRAKANARRRNEIKLVEEKGVV